MTTIDVTTRQAIGECSVTRLGLGCAPLGNLFRAVDDDVAAATVDAAWDAGWRLFDTAPLYGNGLSERRVGAALRARPRNEYVLSTKVGRLLLPGADDDSIFADAPDLHPSFDFSSDGVRRSIEASLERLGLDRIDIVHMHDPDDHLDQAIDEAIPALVALRDEGIIGAVGCGMNVTAPLLSVVERTDVDVVLLAGRYSLLDRSGGDELLPRCAERGVAVIVGGVFNSGLLADPDTDPTYDYAPAPTPLAERARAMRDVCERFGVSLPAAAIGFALRHRSVTSVVIGARSPAEVGDAEHVHGEDALPVVGGRRDDVADAGHAGVVAQHVDPSMPIDDVGDRVLTRSVVGDVEAVEEVEPDNGVAVGGEPRLDRRADPATCAGDHHDSSAHRLLHLMLSRFRPCW